MCYHLLALLACLVLPPSAFYHRICIIYKIILPYQEASRAGGRLGRSVSPYSHIMRAYASIIGLGRPRGYLCVFSERFSKKSGFSTTNKTLLLAFIPSFYFYFMLNFKYPKFSSFFRLLLLVGWGVGGHQRETLV